MTTAPPFALGTRTADEPEPDLTSIVVVHRGMRQDLRRLAAGLGQITAWGVPPTQSRAVCRYTMALLTEIRAHHRGEDDIFWPVIAAAASRAVQALASFTGEPSPFAVKLYALVSELRDMLDEHIADEEGQIFAIMRRYLPARACQWCEKQVQRNAPLRGVRFTAPWLARYAQPDELSRLLATGGRRVRILLAAARPGYTRLERQAFGVSAAVRYQR
jgi:hypothetical protein